MSCQAYKKLLKEIGYGASAISKTEDNISNSIIFVELSTTYLLLSRVNQNLIPTFSLFSCMPSLLLLPLCQDTYYCDILFMRKSAFSRYINFVDKCRYLLLKDLRRPVPSFWWVPSFHSNTRATTYEYELSHQSVFLTKASR